MTDSRNFESAITVLLGIVGGVFGGFAGYGVGKLIALVEEPRHGLP